MGEPHFVDHATRSIAYTPFGVRWVPGSARVAAVGASARGTGVVQVLALEKGRLEVKSEKETAAGIKCATFRASEFEDRRLATGDYNGSLCLWDLDRAERPTFEVKAHAGMVNCIDGCGGLNIGGGAPELATGSRDGTVRVWDPRQREPVASLEPAEGEGGRDCWAVAFGNSFSDEERCLAAGYDNGDVKLLDLRTGTLRWEANVGNGVVGLEFDRRDIKMNKLAVTGLEAAFRVYDMTVEEDAASVDGKAHKSTVWGAHHLPQDRDTFVTAGGNGTLDAWRYVYPDKRKVKDEKSGKERGVPGTLTRLGGKRLSEQPVVSFDWNADKRGLYVAATLDQSLRVGMVTRL